MKDPRETALEECIRELRRALEYYADDETGWDQTAHADVYEHSRDLVPDAAKIAWLTRQALKAKA